MDNNKANRKCIFDYIKEEVADEENNSHFNASSNTTPANNIDSFVKCEYMKEEFEDGYNEQIEKRNNNNFYNSIEKEKVSENEYYSDSLTKLNQTNDNSLLNKNIRRSRIGDKEQYLKVIEKNLQEDERFWKIIGKRHLRICLDRFECINNVKKSFIKYVRYDASMIGYDANLTEGVNSDMDKNILKTIWAMKENQYICKLKDHEVTDNEGNKYCEDIRSNQDNIGVYENGQNKNTFTKIMNSKKSRLNSRFESKNEGSISRNIEREVIRFKRDHIRSIGLVDTCKNKYESSCGGEDIQNENSCDTTTTLYKKDSFSDILADVLKTKSAETIPDDLVLKYSLVRKCGVVGGSLINNGVVGGSVINNGVIESKQNLVNEVENANCNNENVPSIKEFKIKTENDESELKMKETSPNTDYLFGKDDGNEVRMLGVFADKKIQRGRVFGPYVGEKVFDRLDSYDNGYCWDIYRNNTWKYCIDGRNADTSNWMRFVRPTNKVKHQNIEAFQKGYQVYFRAIKSLRVGRELLVWSGMKYNQDRNDILPQEEKLQSSATTTMSDLLKHIRKVKKIQKNLNRPRLHCCHSCPKAFTTRDKLQTHVRVHTGEKPYQCDYCHLAFTQGGTLQKHVLTHTGSKPFECKVCHRFFRESGTLSKHTRIHTGERPYQCDFCQRFFTFASNLRVHRRTHTGEKPYGCDVCGKNFVTLCKMKRHKTTHKNILVLG